MRRVIITLVLSAVTLAVGACGQSHAENDAMTTGQEGGEYETPFSKDYEICIAGLSRQDTMDCLDEEYARQDARLNENYRTLSTSPDFDRIREMQRAWLNWVEPYCDLEGELGMGVALSTMECRTVKTNEQADFLAELGSQF